MVTCTVQSANRDTRYPRVSVLDVGLDPINIRLQYIYYVLHTYICILIDAVRMNEASRLGFPHTYRYVCTRTYNISLLCRAYDPNWKLSVPIRQNERHMTVIPSAWR